MSNPPDPFLEAQADLLSTLQQTRALHSSYLRIRSLASSATSPELVQARQELQTALEDLSADLQDLIDSVKAVETDPFRYGLDEVEVGRRRQLVKDVGDEVATMQDQLRGLAVDAAGQATGKSSKLAQLPPPSAFDDLEGARDVENDDEYAAFEHQRQLEMMREQDEQLDGVFSTVGNLRAQADSMGRELEEQVGILEDTDQLADRVGSKLQSGIKRVGWVIRNNEGISPTRQLYCSGLLIDSRNLVELLYWSTHTCADLTSGPGHHPLNFRPVKT